MLGEEFNLVQCKCGNMIEVVKGDIIQMKQDDGK